MANKIVLVNEQKITKEIVVKTPTFGLHLSCLLKKYPNGKEVFEWGDFLYAIKRVNPPIRLFDDLILIAELKQDGHYFIVETSDDNGKTWEFLEGSKSYTNYDECYNAMKIEATSSMADNIDITQDFDFAEENTHSMQITFGHDYIVYHYSGKLMRFTMCGNW